MRSCFIPNCDANNRDRRNRPFFNVPKDLKLYTIWKEVLPKKRELKSTDKVCVDHFDESDLITTYETLVNGKMVIIPRGRPKLNENAIPCRNLANCDYPKRGRKCGVKNTKNEKCEISLKKISLKRVKVKKVSNLNEKSCNVIVHTIEESFPDEAEEFFKELCEEENTNEEVENNVVNVVSINIDKNKIDECNTICQNNKQVQKEKIKIFNDLYEDIFEVELPSTLWAIHRDPSNVFIAFTYFDPILYLSSKSIILYNNLKAAVNLFNKHFLEKDLNDSYSIEDVGELLKEVDKIRLCSSNKELHSSCELKLSENDDSVCTTCSQEQY
ncbi:uncharacterized protein LOC129605569 [Condylostylus longicornis]|uniref:uncharacterized protein LOC129605569 n=1 Tax=Condylostylus longicornis TaxID=2530218 RepID=UPI00244E23C9|nr:uncharacterized protein LOC129605569 [Condylostylus longicornis]